jgi:hypothetical protein
VADRNGVAVIDFTDHVFALFGAESVVGRAFVVHGEFLEFNVYQIEY